MYSPTTPREVTVVDGVLLIIASPPARALERWRERAHVAPALVGRRQLDRRPTHTARLYSKRSSRGAVLGVPYIRAFAESMLRLCLPCIPAFDVLRQTLQVGARLGNRSGGRPPSGLFRENTNLEWMVLVSRKRTPAVESIFRAGLRVRTDRAASAPRAATTPRRSPPSPLAILRGLSCCPRNAITQEMASLCGWSPV